MFEIEGFDCLSLLKVVSKSACELDIDIGFLRSTDCETIGGNKIVGGLPNPETFFEFKVLFFACFGCIIDTLPIIFTF